MTWTINSKTRDWMSSASRIPLIEALIRRKASRTVVLAASYAAVRSAEPAGPVPILLGRRQGQHCAIHFTIGAIEINKDRTAHPDAVRMQENLCRKAESIGERPAGASQIQQQRTSVFTANAAVPWRHGWIVETHQTGRCSPDNEIGFVD
jgi:hypothetical protein